ncbi:BON domain-containing protein [Acidiphilium sp.]|uniref:BON domain-containing protein n=1 Tax=Acidiphilium sp. TaxID=527 RepID=UPI003CFD7253
MSYVNDLDLRRDVEDELEFEPGLKAAGIGVAVSGGVVTLTGHVGSYAEKLAAERAAGRVKGVRAIAADIEVRPPAEPDLDDDDIARRAANILAWSVYLPADAVRITVEQGWLTLSGDVKSQHQRQAAVDAVHHLAGVVGVTNLITVHPPVTVADVHDRIMSAYRRNAELDSSGIKIAVEGGRVTLSGKVKAWTERRTAENAAWAIQGVTEVVDHLKVG